MRQVLPFLVFILALLPLSYVQAQVFVADSAAVNPWTKRKFENNEDHFQFAIVSDRTGGHRDGVFEKAIEKVNKLHPEFVMCVGDLIEGYSKDPQVLATQWAEWDAMIGKLNMRFFALPGNHDISNEVMRKVWLERYGKAWYHFVYKNVLFITMDSNDGNGLSISRSQIDYVKKAIADNPQVRWTMLYMHHPVWNYKDFNGFSEIEAALQSRPYTVVAGHNHQYLKTQRNNRNYYILASTGASSQLRGPRFQEFDHVTWVTFTDQGPELVNLALSGIHNDDLVDDAGMAKAKSMLDAVNFKPQLLKINEGRAQVLLNIYNSGQDTLNFKSQLFHHHQLSPSQGKFNFNIAPQSNVQINFEITPSGNTTFDKAAPLELDWEMSMPSAFMEAPYHLEGTLPISIDFTPPNPMVNERTVFLQQHLVELKPAPTGLSMRYTLDGSEPSLNSPVYQQPIALNATTTLKVRYFNAQNGAATATWQKEYRKVTTLEGVKIKPGKPGMNYQYYEGDFRVLPDFKTLKPTKSGIVQDFNAEKLAAPRLNHYAVVYEAYLEVPADGMYYFYTRSDDGTKLYLHDQLVVDNDGLHLERTLGGDIPLKKGLHPFRLEYFQGAARQSLFVGFSGEDGVRKPVIGLPLLSK